MIHDVDLRSEVLLSLQAALLAAVTPNLRGVTCAWTRQAVDIRAIYAAAPTEDETELMSEVETNMLAGLPRVRVELDVRVEPPPTPLNPLSLQAWAYRRWEPVA